MLIFTQSNIVIYVYMNKKLTFPQWATKCSSAMLQSRERFIQKALKMNLTTVEFSSCQSQAQRKVEGDESSFVIP